MQVHKTNRFFAELEVIVDFIAQDSFKRAEKFATELGTKINDLPHFPYKCRQSQKSNLSRSHGLRGNADYDSMSK